MRVHNDEEDHAHGGHSGEDGWLGVEDHHKTGADAG